MSRQSENRAKKEIQVGFEVKDSRQADKLAAKWQKIHQVCFWGSGENWTPFHTLGRMSLNYI
jgi:hypothetical protein